MALLGDEIDKLDLLEKRRKILAQRLDVARKRERAQEEKVYEQMIAEGWEPNKSSFNRNGHRFRPYYEDYAVVQDAERLRNWVKGYDEGIIVEKFSKSELNRIVREKRDNGEPLPPGLGSYTKTSVGTSGLMSDDEQGGGNGEG